jgi:hypothetical protein
MAERITYDRVMQTAMGFFASKTLMSAVELGVFGALARGPLDAETLRRRLAIHERAARDFSMFWWRRGCWSEIKGVATSIALRRRVFSTLASPVRLVVSSKCSTRGSTAFGARLSRRSAPVNPRMRLRKGVTSSPTCTPTPIASRVFYGA